MEKITKNKILCVFLITIMLLSISASVFAADEIFALQDASSAEAIALDLYKKDKADRDSSGIFDPELEPGAKTVAEAYTGKYVAKEGYFELTDKSRFYIVTDKLPTEEMLNTVRLMNAQFASEEIPGGTVLPIVYGKEKFAEKGDILIILLNSNEDKKRFSLDVDTSDIKQSYILKVEEDRISITSPGKDGIYYGMITLLQMAKEKENADGKTTLDCCYIEDGPDSAERTVFLDCGRKYFTREWIENFIRRSSFQRYNSIVLHFSEAEGFRLDSEIFPWITEGIDSLSREDMIEIAKVARTYNMEIIPSLDIPGHNRYLIEKYEEYVKKNPDFSFTYNGKIYDRDTKGFGSIANHYSYRGKTKKTNGIGIDVTDEYDVAFMDALIDDYAEFFRRLGSTRFDIGGDEILGWNEFELAGKHFNYSNRWEAIEHWDKYAVQELGIEKGTARDTFINYLNGVSERLERYGYKCRVFNDEIKYYAGSQRSKLRESIDIVYWAGGGVSAEIHANKGHTVYHDISKWCYYVVADWGDGDIMTNKYKTVNSANIYNNWDPRSFSSKPNSNKTVREDKFGGAYFSIWCDQPDYKNEKTIWKETELRTWANSAKMWNPEINTKESGIGAPVTYNYFKKFAESMGSFPGYKGDPTEEINMPEPPILKIEGSFWQKLISFF